MAQQHNSTTAQHKPLKLLKHSGVNVLACKQILMLMVVTLLNINNTFSQSQNWWKVDGNSNGSSSTFIGTTNNQPLVFKTNNTTRGTFTSTGNFQLVNLQGTTNRLLQADASGNIIPFAMGNANEVLYGNGTWGTLPNMPTLFWQQHGTDLYYMDGKVGIGTNTPLVSLDVIGDARVSNNLYVGGGVIITEKVNANAEVLTGSLKADSIKMDSTKAVYGYSIFKDKVKLENKLQVIGNTQIDGDFRVNGSFTFGNRTLSYLYGSISTPEIIGWGPVPATAQDIFANCGSTTTLPLNATYNQFQGMIQCFGNNLTPTGNYNLMTMGYDGANGIIDVRGDNTAGGTIHGAHGPDLLINYNCGKDVYACTGPLGGFVSVGRYFEVGNPQRSGDIAINVNAIAQTGLFLTTTHNNDYEYNTKLAVNRNKAKALSIYNDASQTENVVIFGDGTTGIGTNTPTAKLDVVNANNLAIPGLRVASTFINTSTNMEIPNILSEVDQDLRKAFVVANSNGTYSENFVVYGDGHVFARDIRVTLDPFVRIPDFVFEKEYKLMTLQEVEKYIQSEKHLPNVPSEREIKSNGGISVGEMAVIQLQKVEELTLYLIELNKKVNELTNLVESQQKIIEELKK